MHGRCDRQGCHLAAIGWGVAARVEQNIQTATSQTTAGGATERALTPHAATLASPFSRDVHFSRPSTSALLSTSPVAVLLPARARRPVLCLPACVLGRRSLLPPLAASLRRCVALLVRLFAVPTP